MRTNFQLFYSLSILTLLAHGEKNVINSSENSGGRLPVQTPIKEASDTDLLTSNLKVDISVNIPELGVIIGDEDFSFPFSFKKFHYFAGIPYADSASYTGINRFKPSKIWEGKLPVDSEKGGFLAKNFSIKCPQLLKTSDNFIGDMEFQKKVQRNRSRVSNNAAEDLKEDCLVLNVYTPILDHPKQDCTYDETELLPVIVHVHGGSFDSSWSGNYRGNRFMKKDVVFVTVNYRLSILGSLNLQIDEAPGNAAMYDIITALKWIKRHIGCFGGNRNRVTVSGHSSGAALATHLLTSDLAIDDDGGVKTPLLHGIIGLSGSSLSQTLATCTDPLTHHLRVSQLAGCYNGNDTPPNLQEIRNCMATQPLPKLLAAMNTYKTHEINAGRFGLDAYLPSLQDKNKIKANPLFMTETPYSVLKQEKQNLNIPVMMGVTRHDGSYLVDQALQQYWGPHNFTTDPLFLRNHLLPTLIESLDLTDGSGELIHSLEKMYLGEAMHTDDFQSKIPGLIDIYSVLAFKAGAYNLVELNSKKNNNSFYFSFEYSGLCSVKGSEEIPGGIGHMDSLFYLFPFPNTCPIILPDDLKVSNRFIDYWVNFATLGNPNGKGPTSIAAGYNPYNHAYLVIEGKDRTAYYCRDAWINNSLDLVKDNVTPNPSDKPTFQTQPPVTDSTTTLTVNTVMLMILNLIVYALFQK